MRSLRLPAAASLFAATLLVALAAPAHATKIERVVSPGGIEAWLVQDKTVPLIALDFAFLGGATQDPADKAGVANLVSALLAEGAGELDSKTSHERLEAKAIQLAFSAVPDHSRASFRTLLENRDEAVELLRLALTAPLRRRRGGAHTRQGDRAAYARDHEPQRHQQQALVVDRIPIASLRPPRQRHARNSAADRRRRPEGLHAARPRPRQAQDRRGRRYRRGRHRRPARPRVRTARSDGAAHAGDRCEARGPRQAHRDRSRRAAGSGDVRRSRDRPQGSRLHGGLYRQSHPRRRLVLVAPLPRGAREARSCLFGPQPARMAQPPPC